ncbi:hypothetical protein XI06_00580 [Bradyrhizobium sp. CCBAU 11434]|nr:hypothetical protein [Bradyrhizobium sp. CCBAU 11434]
MLNQRLNAHYSVLALLSRVGFCGGLAVMLWFVAAQMRSQNWFTVTSYIVAAAMACAALAFSYLLLTARGQVVVSIDETGFRDERLTSTAIPWNVIQSVSPYIPSRSRSATGIELVIEPKFRQTILMRPAGRLFGWVTRYSISGPAICLDTSILDAECDEISRIANSYMSGRS